jgi:hypothetical protein
MTPRTRAVVSGGVVIALYLAGAVLSGHLSPFARRPLLDGLAPVAPYRWVSPPPGAASTNKAPTPGRFTLPFTRDGIRGGAFATPDVQVTVIVPHGAFTPEPGQRSIELTVQPIAPSRVAPPPGSLVVLGNVVRIEARYEPSGDPVTAPAKAIEVVLLYPFVSTDSGRHVLLTSPGGTSWTTVRATDHVASAQLLGSIRTFGDVVAAGTRLARASGVSAPSGARSSVGTVLVLAVGALLVLLVLFLVFRGRDGRGRR